MAEQSRNTEPRRHMLAVIAAGDRDARVARLVAKAEKVAVAAFQSSI